MIIRRSKIISLFMLGILSATSTFANQVFTVTENDVVEAHISKNDLNHIAVMRDRIKCVRGLEGQYTLNEDLQTGHIYLKQLINSSHQSINLFLTTEKGKTYQMRLLPDARSAETILLVDKK